jgi:UDP-N-acetylglucosamine 1-carboxyvinyltransferase
VNGTDLRASAAMVLAALVAKGKSQVSGLDHLDRGYADIEAKLGRVGAKLTRHTA